MKNLTLTSDYFRRAFLYEADTFAQTVLQAREEAFAYLWSS
jgi:hypothetical protein